MQSLLLKEGNVETEMIPRQINSHAPVCMINILPWNKVLKSYSNVAACIDGVWAEEGPTHQPLQEQQEAIQRPSSQKSKGSLFGQGLSVTCLQVNAKRILITNKRIKNHGKALLYRHDNLFLSKEELSSWITLTDPLHTFALLN